MLIADSYLIDAKSHISLAAGLIKQDMSAAEQWQAVLFAGVGVEKLLKHVLARVNPAFVLKNQDFESIVVACHSDDVTATDKVAELRKKAVADVVTLRTSVQRSMLFCNGVKQHSQLIHTLADMRDVAAHRPWSEIDTDRARVVLCRDFFNAVKDIATCVGEPPAQFFGEHYGRLEVLSAAVAANEDLIAKMVNLLNRHRNLWADRQKNPTLVEGARKITANTLSHHPYATECRCPACDNEAVATLEHDIDYDYDPEDGSAQAYITGVYVTQIKCFFCSLQLDEYDQLNYVDADTLLAETSPF